MVKEVGKKNTLRRVVAYIIDMTIVLSVVLMFSKISILNKNYDKYNEVYEEYTELYEDYLDSVSNNSSYIDDGLVNEINSLSYKLSYYSVSSSIIEIVMLILYFVVFGFINKGMTVGKMILGVKVVDCDSNKVSFVRYMFRCIIVYGLFTKLLSILMLCFCSESFYLNYYTYVYGLEMTLMVLCYGFTLFREDGRGFHDVVCKTNVIRVNKGDK